MRCISIVACMEEMRNAYTSSVKKPEGMKTLYGIPECKWEYNNKIKSKVNNYEAVDWIHLAEDTDQWYRPL
jgi:hypothetical protein